MCERSKEKTEFILKSGQNMRRESDTNREKERQTQEEGACVCVCVCVCVHAHAHTHTHTHVSSVPEIWSMFTQSSNCLGRSTVDMSVPGLMVPFSIVWN